MRTEQVELTVLCLIHKDPTFLPICKKFSPTAYSASVGAEGLLIKTKETSKGRL